MRTLSAPTVNPQKMATFFIPFPEWLYLPSLPQVLPRSTGRPRLTSFSSFLFLTLPLPWTPGNSSSSSIRQHGDSSSSGSTQWRWWGWRGGAESAAPPGTQCWRRPGCACQSQNSTAAWKSPQLCPFLTWKCLGKFMQILRGLKDRKCEFSDTVVIKKRLIKAGPHISDFSSLSCSSFWWRSLFTQDRNCCEPPLKCLSNCKPKSACLWLRNFEIRDDNSYLRAVTEKFVDAAYAFLSH